MPDRTIQYSNPKQPATYCRNVGKRRRWEFAIKDNLSEKNQLEDKIALIKMSFKELDERDMVNSFKEFIKGNKKHETKE